MVVFYVTTVQYEIRDIDVGLTCVWFWHVTTCMFVAPPLQSWHEVSITRRLPPASPVQPHTPPTVPLPWATWSIFYPCNFIISRMSHKQKPILCDLWDWLFSFNIISLRSIHVAACPSSSSLVIAESYSMAEAPQFNHEPVEGQLWSFPVWSFRE